MMRRVPRGGKLSQSSANVQLVLIFLAPLVSLVRTLDDLRSLVPSFLLSKAQSSLSRDAGFGFSRDCSCGVCVPYLVSPCRSDFPVFLCDFFVFLEFPVASHSVAKFLFCFWFFSVASLLH